MSLPAARHAQISYLSRVVLLCIAVSSAWFATACGGRWRTFMEVPDDDGMGLAGGGAAAAGASSAGSAGAAPTAGAGALTSSGGASACDPTTCVSPSCPDGSMLALLTGDCCPSCQPICKQACDACQPGFHEELHAGDCCPTCIPDTQQSEAACAMGQAAYMPVRDRLAYRDSYGCMSDAECVLTAPSNRCELGCGYTALFYQGLDDFTQGTAAEAAVDCGTCSQGATPKCVPPTIPHCYNGQCAFTQP